MEDSGRSLEEACREEVLAAGESMLVVLGSGDGSFPHGLGGKSRWA